MHATRNLHRPAVTEYGGGYKWILSPLSGTLPHNTMRHYSKAQAPARKGTSRLVKGI
jgi:hypothetical protein